MKSITFFILIYNFLYAQFLPTDVNNIKLWLDASDATTITASSGDVSQWNDKSGLGNNVSNAGAGKPTTGAATINSKNVIDFNLANSEYLARSDALGLSGNPSITIFIVLKTVAAGSGQRFLTIGNGAVAGQSIQYATDGSYRYGNGSCIFSNLSTNAELTRWVKTAGGVYASASEPQLWINTVQKTTASSSASVINIANTNLTIGAGHGGSPASFYSGYVAEIIIYNAILTNDEIASIEDYLNDKWGLGLTTTCPLCSTDDGQDKGFKEYNKFPKFKGLK